MIYMWASIFIKIFVIPELVCINIFKKIICPLTVDHYFVIRPIEKDSLDVTHLYVTEEISEKVHVKAILLVSISTILFCDNNHLLWSCSR